MTLTQIDETNFIITPTNQPLPPLSEIEKQLQTSDFVINTQITAATKQTRTIHSDNHSNPSYSNSKTLQKPITTHIVTLN